MPSLPKRFTFKDKTAKSVASRTTTEKGYGAAWQKLRKQVLDAEPLCRPCTNGGCVTAATQVDHITPKALGGTDALTNLQPICTDCHKAKTRQDIQRINRGY